MKIKNSPWGKVQTCEEMTPGVFSVTTPGHGGIMIEWTQAPFELKKYSSGFHETIHRENLKQYICFEEDCEWALVPLFMPQVREKMLLEGFINDEIITSTNEMYNKTFIDSIEG